jgi:integrase/recombinase XerD
MQVYPSASLTLFTRDGRRKYLTSAERERFISAALGFARAEIGTLCLVIAYTGCRISEALALTVGSVDAAEGAIVFRSLKKRQAVVFRPVPVPPHLVERLTATLVIGEQDSTRRLWSISRSRAWQLIKLVMAHAEVASGPHRTPKGLRHGFGIHALRSGNL